MRYEAKHARPISNRHFFFRLLWHGGAVVVLVVVSLGVGMWGYRHYEGLAWRDAFLNASMLLGGEGPVEVPQTPGGKVFAGGYALYSGLVFIICAGVLFVPVIHRILHHFHFDDRNG
jgi:hypothetical protein